MNVPDLNFLYVVQALFEEKSVSRAARRLGLTQPAVSHALGRLRVIFQDDLFVRAGAVMAPTPTGERVAMGAIRALALIQQDIWDARTFDPLTTTRTFSVCMSDMGMMVLLPRLLGALQQYAPHATLKPIQVQSLELASVLQDGAIDLAIGYLGKMGENLYQQALLRRSLVGIIRQRKNKKPAITLERFINSKHVLAGTLALTNQLLAEELRLLGARLMIAIEVPYLLSVPSVVATSDFIACVPSELAELFSRLADIEVFELPVHLPDLTVKQFWHARFHDDPVHQWFRKLVAETLGDKDVV
ncbi:LysR family transcriptional regulator [Glaciimonas sp. PAMC28666]|uniref:LysR family transcriptional regulator n=1 Tax=Glaciimonas sp. PAMC28666 TaxID=2807626 RepID=UPI001962A485|nr:LysR family transcriptional regulator [Glaciimonas sp. PAMC28666]QRX81729.1 LysR family transcriptional regulator [Glaciimonas sp. PAMC28666]